MKVRADFPNIHKVKLRPRKWQKSRPFSFLPGFLEDLSLRQVWLAAKSTSKDMGRAVLGKSGAFSNS